MILSIGTKIVAKVETRPIGGGEPCPAGIVGIVVASPVDSQHAYRVRYANGIEANVRRSDIELLGQYQTDGILNVRGGVAIERPNRLPHV